MFGLVFSAFPKPSNTLHILTEVLPTLLPPPCPCSSQLVPPGGTFPAPCPSFGCSQRWAQGHRAWKELTELCLCELSYLQV